jgi:hypothetical protein
VFCDLWGKALTCDGLLSGWVSAFCSFKGKTIPYFEDLVRRGSVNQFFFWKALLGGERLLAYFRVYAPFSRARGSEPERIRMNFREYAPQTYEQAKRLECIQAGTVEYALVTES